MIKRERRKVEKIYSAIAMSDYLLIPQDWENKMLSALQSNTCDETTREKQERAVKTRRISLKGLRETLSGKNHAPWKMPNVLAPAAIENVAYGDEAFLLDLFQGTKFEVKEWLIVGVKNKKGIIDILCSGQAYFREKYKVKIGNNVLPIKKYTHLLKIWKDDPSGCLREILGNVRELLVDQIPREALDCINRLFAYVVTGGVPECENLSEQVFRRQITLLAVSGFLHEEIIEGMERWVITGNDADLTDLYDESASSVRFGTQNFFSTKRNEIDIQLLPPILYEGELYSVSYSENEGSPLNQIMSMHAPQVMLLCGDPRTGSNFSGAGKTSALLFFYEFENTANSIFLPLTAIYSSDSPLSAEKSDESRLIRWMKETGYLDYNSEADLAEKILLLDGLDEVKSADMIACFCRDLSWASRFTSAKLVITCRGPVQQLSSWEQGLSDMGRIWQSAHTAYIQPIPREQRLSYLKKKKTNCHPTLVEQLRSPFLLQAHASSEVYLSEGSYRRMQRWLFPSQAGKTPENREGVIYRSLITQICRWFDGQHDSVAGEVAAIHTLFTLPAIAYRSHINELAGDFLPGSMTSHDENYARTVLDRTIPLFGKGLQYYRAYKGMNEYGLPIAAPHLTYKGFLTCPAASSIFIRELDFQTFEWRHRFANLLLRDELATMHIANMFFLAVHDSLNETLDNILLCFASPIQYISRTMIKASVAYLDEISGETGYAKKVLDQGPDALKITGLYSRWLISQLAVEICDTFGMKTISDWVEYGISVYEIMEHSMPEMATLHGREYLVRFLTRKTQVLRSSMNFKEALEVAEEICRIHDEKPHLFEIAIGYHAKGKVYLDQVSAVLNGKDMDRVFISTVPRADLRRGYRIFEAVEALSMAVKSGESFECSEWDVLFETGEVNHKIIDSAVELLQKASCRLNAYATEKRDGALLFEQSLPLQFLLEGAFVGKCYMVYAALHPGAGGGALQSLGCLVENDDETFENSPKLPFFKKNPHLHLPVGNLRYENKDQKAFHLFLRINEIPRGKQPYSSKKISEALLSRRVRIGTNSEHDFTDEEWDVLEESTCRACTSAGASYSIPRIRYINERYQNSQRTDVVEEEYLVLIRQEWERCSCAKKIKEKKVDLYTAMLLAECRFSENELPTWTGVTLQEAIDAVIKFIENVDATSQISLTYTNGSRLRPEKILDILHRLEYFKSVHAQRAIRKELIKWEKKYRCGSDDWL